MKGNAMIDRKKLQCIIHKWRIVGKTYATDTAPAKWHYACTRCGAKAELTQEKRAA